MAPPLTVRFFLLAWLAAVVTAQDAVVAVPLDDAPTCGWAQFLVTNTEAILGNELVSYTCTPCSLCTPGTRQTGGCEGSQDTVCSACPNSLPANANWTRQNYVYPAAYLGENAASTKCSFDCDLNYRQDGNQSLCYKYGIESMSGGRVEFELKYSLPASELWRALVVKYPKDIEEVYLLGLNQSFGKFLPWHSSICDSRGCWGSMGYLPSKHGPYTNYDTRRQHSAMTLARRDGEEKGKGEVSAEAQGLSKQRRGMGLGGMLLEGANFSVGWQFWYQQRNAGLNVSESRDAYLPVPQTSTLRSYIQVESRADAARVIDFVKSSNFTSKMVLTGCVVVNETIAKQGLEGPASIGASNCSVVAVPSLSVEPHRLESVCYACVDLGDSNKTLGEKCSACCEIRCMESYTLPTSLRSTFSNTYNLKYTYFGNGDGQPTYENMTSLLRELSSQHTQCMSSCNAACASECAPVYKNDDDVPEDVVMRAETVASTVTAFVAVALAVGIASAVGMGMVGGGASGAASSGAGALPLLAQAQFMSIGAKAGGSTAHPSSTQALSGGLCWTNYQGVINLPNTCANAKEDLGGLLITCFIALVSTEALRLLVRLGVWASGRDPKKFEGLIFPRWHILVFQTQFLGLSHSTGSALASPCGGHQFLGVIVFFSLVIYIALVTSSLYHGILKRSMVKFEEKSHISLFESAKKVATARAEGGGLLALLKEKKRTMDEVRTRGEWICKSSQVNQDTPEGGGEGGEGEGEGGGGLRGGLRGGMGVKEASVGAKADTSEVGIADNKDIVGGKGQVSVAGGAFGAVAGEPEEAAAGNVAPLEPSVAPLEPSVAPPRPLDAPTPEPTAPSHDLLAAPKTISIRVRGPEEDEDGKEEQIDPSQRPGRLFVLFCLSLSSSAATKLRTAPGSLQSFASNMVGKSHFLVKMGPVFEDFVEARWWFAAWDLWKKLLIGVFLGTVKPTVPNSTLIMLIYMLDLALVGGWKPHVDKWQYLTECYTASTRVISLIFVVSYMDGTLGAVPFTDAYIAFSMLGIIPLLISSLSGVFSALASGIIAASAHASWLGSRSEVAPVAPLAEGEKGGGDGECDEELRVDVVDEGLAAGVRVAGENVVDDVGLLEMNVELNDAKDAKQGEDCEGGGGGEEGRKTRYDPGGASAGVTPVGGTEQERRPRKGSALSVEDNLEAEAI